MGKPLNRLLTVVFLSGSWIESGGLDVVQFSAVGAYSAGVFDGPLFFGDVLGEWIVETDGPYIEALFVLWMIVVGSAVVFLFYLEEADVRSDRIVADKQADDGENGE